MGTAAAGKVHRTWQIKEGSDALHPRCSLASATGSKPSAIRRAASSIRFMGCKHRESNQAFGLQIKTNHDRRSEDAKREAFRSASAALRDFSRNLTHRLSAGGG